MFERLHSLVLKERIVKQKNLEMTNSLLETMGTRIKDLSSEMKTKFNNLKIIFDKGPNS